MLKMMTMLRQIDYESSVLAEIIMYIEECLISSTPSSTVPSVKLSGIRNFNDSFLSRRVGGKNIVNATRLKDKIINLDSNLQAVLDKREIYISHQDELAATLKYSNKLHSNDVTGLCWLARKIKKQNYMIESK